MDENNKDGMTTPEEGSMDTEKMNMPEQEAPQQTATPAPEPMTEAPATEPEKKSSLLGPIIGIVIILILLILVGLYVRGAMIREDAMMENEEAMMMDDEDADVAALDDIDALVEDLDVDAIDEELEAIDAELDEALSDI
ncbi:hypothetical protein KTR10_00680 [Candidatus Kaiserbacteria bacterium]|nr:hypothetical protein [Candidatus Kaiserbacteria bacterium]